MEVNFFIAFGDLRLRLFFPETEVVAQVERQQ